MENQDGRREVIIRWFDLRRRAVAQVICLVVYYYLIRMSRKRKISCSNKKKNKVAKKRAKDDEFSEIAGAMYEIADALREGNAIMREYLNVVNYKSPPISGEETWNLIKECGCDINSLPKIYCFLMNDTNKLRAVVECPVEERKAVIMQMVFGSSNSPSY